MQGKESFIHQPENDKSPINIPLRHAQTCEPSRDNSTNGASMIQNNKNRFDLLLSQQMRLAFQ